jgi:hypothetical protein
VGATPGAGATPGVGVMLGAGATPVAGAVPDGVPGAGTGSSKNAPKGDAASGGFGVSNFASEILGGVSR